MAMATQSQDVCETTKRSVLVGAGTLEGMAYKQNVEHFVTAQFYFFSVSLVLLLHLNCHILLLFTIWHSCFY